MSKIVASLIREPSKNRLTTEAIAAANRLLYEGKVTDRPTNSVSMARWKAMVRQIALHGLPQGIK